MTAAAKREIIKGGMMSIFEAMRLTGLGRSKLYALMDQGRLPFVKVDKRRLLPRNCVEKLLADNLIGD